MANVRLFPQLNPRLISLTPNTGQARGGRCAKGVHAESINLGAYAGLQAIFYNDIPINRTRIEMSIQLARPIIFNRPE